MRVEVSYHQPHRNVIAAEREAEKVSCQPDTKDDRVLVEEFHQKGIDGSRNGWQSDPDYPPVKVSQWNNGKVMS
jgi:hypothetical protein